MMHGPSNTRRAILHALSRRSYTLPQLRLVVRGQETAPFLEAVTVLEQLMLETGMVNEEGLTTIRTDELTARGR